jgi:hypothetical protein
MSYRVARMPLDDYQSELNTLLSIVGIDLATPSIHAEDILFEGCPKYQNQSPSELLRRGRKHEAYEAAKINILGRRLPEPRELNRCLRRLTPLMQSKQARH